LKKRRHALHDAFEDGPGAHYLDGAGSHPDRAESAGVHTWNGKTTLPVDVAAKDGTDMLPTASRDPSVLKANSASAWPFGSSEVASDSKVVVSKDALFRLIAAPITRRFDQSLPGCRRPRLISGCDISGCGLDSAIACRRARLSMTTGSVRAFATAANHFSNGFREKICRCRAGWVRPSQKCPK
jgi:hypothetical protein